MVREQKRNRGAAANRRESKFRSAPFSFGEVKFGFDVGQSQSPHAGFQPGYASPRQTPRSGSTAELELVQAMLRDAIQSYQKFAFAKRGRSASAYREAEEWIFSDDWRWPFSFLNICEILDLAPTYIRTGLRLWRGRARPACNSEPSPHQVEASYRPLRMIHRRRLGGILRRNGNPKAASMERFRRGREE